MAVQAFSVHPDNDRCFLFRDKPFKILSSAEHYGAVINGDFDYDAYIEELARTGQNATRVFTFYREEPEGIPGVGPANTLAPRPEAAILPWERVEGQGEAADGLPKFDLSRWNDCYFARLKDFITKCGQRGIVCEIVLFCNPYDSRRLDLLPCGGASNINGVGTDLVQPSMFMGLSAPTVFAFQRRFVRKMVSELIEFDNIYYEICNEPSAQTNPATAEDAAQILAWQGALAQLIREIEQNGPQSHLIAANLHPRVLLHKAGDVAVVHHNERHIGYSPHIGILNYHYMSSMVTVRGNRVLRLPGHDPEAGLIQRFLDERRMIRKPMVFDETYSGVMNGAPEQYALNRAEAWETMLGGGAGCSNLDWSFTSGDPTGSGQAAIGDGRRLDGRPLRGWLGLLRQFLERFDLPTLEPAHGLFARPVSTHGYSASVDGTGRTGIYLVDERLYWGETCDPQEVVLEINLPGGRMYSAESFDPRTGRTEYLHMLLGEGPTMLTVPAFIEDIALMLEPHD